MANVHLPGRSHIFADGSTVPFVRRHFGLSPHQGNLFCRTEDRYVAEDGVVREGKIYEFHADATVLPAVPADGVVLQRQYRTLFAIYVLSWATYFFLPRWTSTPALYFFLNSLATILIEWSLKPTAAIVGPWAAVTLALCAQAVYAHWTCIATVHLVAAVALVISRVGGLSSAQTLAVFTVFAGVAWSNLAHCALKHPFGEH
eukprot:m.255554 g.255554  ORF g.255554 m.255554 type:complete len:202 (-) comp19568_c0_seq1:145-750(-)